MVRLKTLPLYGRIGTDNVDNRQLDAEDRSSSRTAHDEGIILCGWYCAADWWMEADLPSLRGSRGDLHSRCSRRGRKKSGSGY